MPGQQPGPAVQKRLTAPENLMRTFPQTTLITQDEFKQGMQQLAACVNVITSGFEGSRRGMTATAVCSLTSDPPSLIVSVNRSARTFDNIANSRKLCVNLLAEDQQSISNVFASSKGDSEEKFNSAGIWTSSASGQPMLEDCVANFVCAVDRWLVTKTHYVVVANICEIRLRDDLKPVLYHGRGYSTMASEPAEMV